MKPSGIGGQAVIEGIMMRNKDKYSIAVRKPDQNIEVVVKESKLLTEKHKWLNYPIIRGIFNFVDSMVVGISTINYSASFYDDPAEQKTTKVDEIGKSIFKDKLESVLMAATVLFSIVFAVALFMLLPYFISRLLAEYIVSKTLLNFIEGLIRVAIFILYLLLISLMSDIKRTFMYHGAEHKCINCIEHGAELTPVNVKNSSRYHKRCGTSFLFLVMFISILFFIFIRVDNAALQVVIRILLIPVIAGVSYEVIRWAGKNDNKWVDILSKPGMWLQGLTTREPDMDMIEVAIKAVEEVFDWKVFLEEYYADSENPEAEKEAVAAELALSASLVINTKKETRTIKTEEALDQEEETQNMTAEERYLAAAKKSGGLDAAYSTDAETGFENVDMSLPDDDIRMGDSNSMNEPEEFLDEVVEESDDMDDGIEIEDDIEIDASIQSDNSKEMESDVSVDEIQEDSEDDENVLDGFEFIEETEEPELNADDLPVFKQRKLDK
ncbi:MAG: DUF1385 domain-containing protein [Lachnospira sp.]|nr:DUF1385 domain-containing protein [Lachnospira sp.]